MRGLACKTDDVAMPTKMQKMRQKFICFVAFVFNSDPGRSLVDNHPSAIVNLATGKVV